MVGAVVTVATDGLVAVAGAAVDVTSTTTAVAVGPAAVGEPGVGVTSTVSGVEVGVSKLGVDVTSMTDVVAVGVGVTVVGELGRLKKSKYPRIRASVATAIAAHAQGGIRFRLGWLIFTCVLLSIVISSIFLTKQNATTDV